MTTSLLLHPALPYALAAALAPFAGVAGRRVLSLAAPGVALALFLALPPDATAALSTLGHEWILLRADGLARVFALAFLLYGLVAGVFAWTDTGAGARGASFALCGAGIGVVLAGDLLSLFFFWEWLTVSSLFLIWQGNTPGAFAAGLRYLALHLLGAVLLLAGILLHLGGGSATLGALAMEHPGSWLILAGMLLNAAVPPLHAWLADAYPRASIFGTVFLAAYTTKAAVYALARCFPGVELLVWAGAAMALFGVVYAVLENDIRRLLAYHVISQVGYMVAGVGLGSALALGGAAAHAFSHIFYKGLLLMAAGAVIHATGRGRLTELGGLAGPLRWALVFMMIGAFSISGVPLFNGFVSKSMVVSAAAEADRGAIELMLLVASMGTFLHTGLKLPWFTFFGERRTPEMRGTGGLRPVPSSMYVAMSLAAAVCIVTGLFPERTLYLLLPFEAGYAPYTAHHVFESLQLLVGTALGFWLLRRKLGGEATTTRDVDVLYRAPVRRVVEGAGALFEGLGRLSGRVGAELISSAAGRLDAARRRHEGLTLAAQSTWIVAALAIVGALLVFARQ